jgi:DNA-binding MarR family transcriptional regulator
MELNQCINNLLSKAQLSVHQRFKEKLTAYDITPVQYGVLKCLWNTNGLCPRTIAETLGLDGSTITGILDRLEHKGLIVRTLDEEDRRSLRVVLTDKGFEIEASVVKTVEDANDAVLRSFSEDEVILFKKLLEKITCP